MNNQGIRFFVNHREVETAVNQELSLLRFLRDHLRLTGTKCGCEAGECGACSVILDGRAVRSCRVKIGSLAGKQVATIEGLAPDGKLHPLQIAFIKADAFQCGFCTPGIIMAAKALLDANPEPADDEIKGALAGNLCRCTGYRSIIEAVHTAASLMASGAEGMLPPASLPEDMNIGSSPSDKDAYEKISGTLLFADDLYREAMLWGKLLFAPAPCISIETIDVSAAEQLGGVVKILTAKDVPGKNCFGRMIPHQPVLVDNKTRFIGDVLAVVFAETADIAQEALSLITVDYHLEEGAFSFQESLAAGAPEIHAGGNLMKTVANKKGDIEEGFAKSDIIEEGTYFTPFVEHGFLEPEAGLAYLDNDGVMTIHYPTQAPFHVRKQVADSLGWPEEKIRVIATPLGGGFGGKTDVTIEILLALGALHTQRPVKITLQRSESLRIDTKRHPFFMRYKTGVTNDGKLMALKAKIFMDVGAYAGISPGVLEQATIFAGGPYVWPHLLMEGVAVYTNNVLGGAFRGFGINQVNFAVETQMDRMARRLGKDPIDFRLENALDVGLETGTGEILLASVGIRETLGLAKKALEETTIERSSLPRWKKLGVGIASGYKNIGYGRGYSEHAGAILELRENGEIWLRVSAIDMGQGVKTVLSQMVATETGVDYGQIKVTAGDTALVPEGVAAVAQRQTYIAGNATVEAAKKFKAALLTAAAREMQCRPDEIELRGSRLLAQSRNSLTLAELYRRLGAKKETIQVEAHYYLPATSPLRGDTSPTYLLYQQQQSGKTDREEDVASYRNYIAYSYVTQIAIVEVNMRTGEVQVRKVIAAHDVGRALHPQKIKGQLEGSIVMGIGYALTEEFRMQEGVNLTKTLRQCGIPDISKTPVMELIVVEDPEPGGPYGAKGMSEVALVPTAAAITNAIFDAIGVRIDSLPAKPEKILAGLRHRGEFS